MKILFCVEFYFPSLGGAQEVVRHLAERMVRNGHAVSVATSRIDTRKSDRHSGVRIVEFRISGNMVRGMQGDVRAYQDFLANTDFDVILFYAAQQWTFDAAWPILNRIKARKVLVPCGYSGLFEPAYEEYFAALPEVLRGMDAVVYHAVEYRDVQFGASAGIDHAFKIPNGADLEEFDVPLDSDFRLGLSIPENALLFLTVGTMTGLKGHLELAQAFKLADFGGKAAVLILNGNTPEFSGKKQDIFGLLGGLTKEYGIAYAAKHGLKILLQSLGFEIGRPTSIQDWARKINQDKASRKQVIVVDLPRKKLVQAYLQADLFVFASNIEYSPLVLFEACAAGLPFLSVPVGNAEEIAIWTGGGKICPATRDERGYTRVEPGVLANHIEQLAGDPGCLATLRKQGKEACCKRYNWNAIAMEYERLFESLIAQGSMPRAT